MKNFILFDFDGVIADSFLPAYGVNKMICPHLTKEDYKKRFEGNIHDSNNWEIHTEECRKDVDFDKEYIPKFKNEAILIPDITETIQKLYESYVLIIISSNITSVVQEFLDEHQLLKYFTLIMGNDIHKSKIEKIKIVLSKYNILAEQCVFITDTLGDIREAEKTKIGSIGVSWGYQDKKTLLLGNPYKIVDIPKELPATVSDYFIK